MATNQIPIGRFSQITRLSTKALRLYDERGLLVPATKDIATGYRYYTGTQIARGVSIKELCGIGFSLLEIEAILSAKDAGDGDTIREHFRRRQGAIRSEVARLQQIEAILARSDASLEMMFMSSNEPVVREVAPQRVLKKRGVGSYQEMVPALIQELCSQLFSEENQRAGLKITGPVMTMYLDSEYREKDATIECAVPITGKVVVSDPAMEITTLPGGQVVSLIHKGPYAGLHGAWSRIGKYLEEREFTITLPPREMYLNDPGMVPEDELLTEIQIPIDKRPRGKIS
jgi:effector-binding domain-containing protein